MTTDQGDNVPSLQIRVTDYNGDLDTLSELTLIGPYASEQARDEDLVRLAAIPGLYGGYEFEPSELTDGDYLHEASKFASVETEDDFAAALYGVTELT